MLVGRPAAHRLMLAKCWLNRMPERNCEQWQETGNGARKSEGAVPDVLTLPDAAPNLAAW